ncbi:MAG TPA: NADAR family protein [Ktedonobacterales bacterium]|nr:NADAR family protein [Ktedonobacterales bacterium]
MSERARILFSGLREAHGYLSNFWPAPIMLNDVRWPTVEHYFQAQKFAGSEHEEVIRRVASPMIAARMGRSHARPLRSDWDAVKERIMLDALRAKFLQHPDLGERLRATGDALLIEHTIRDAYWGDGGDGHGLNRLGELLMRTRAEILDGA